MRKIQAVFKWFVPSREQFLKMTPSERLGLISAYLGLITFMISAAVTGYAYYVKLLRDQHFIAGDWNSSVAHEMAIKVVKDHYKENGAKEWTKDQIEKLEFSCNAETEVDNGAEKIFVFVRAKLDELYADDIISNGGINEFINISVMEYTYDDTDGANGWRLTQPHIDVDVRRDPHSESEYYICRVGPSVIGIKRLTWYIDSRQRYFQKSFFAFLEGKAQWVFTYFQDRELLDGSKTLACYIETIDNGRLLYDIKQTSYYTGKDTERVSKQLLLFERGEYRRY